MQCLDVRLFYGRGRCTSGRWGFGGGSPRNTELGLKVGVLGAEPGDSNLVGFKVAGNALPNRPLIGR
jgi:hypothetical protein